MCSLMSSRKTSILEVRDDEMMMVVVMVIMMVNCNDDGDNDSEVE